MAYRVRKLHKRLWIEEAETGELVYTPPDFIRLSNRTLLQGLAEALNAGAPRIKAIVAFETAARPCKGD